LPGFLRSFDRDGRESDRAFYLEAWNGNGRFTYDRIGRGTVDIEACCVSIFGCIQPGPLADYLSAAVRGGAGDDGLMQRFQVAVWPDAPADWQNVDRLPDADAKEAAARAFARLDTIDAASVGAETDRDGRPFLRFAPDAQEAFDEWRSSLETRLRRGDEPPAIEAHLAKYRSLVPALALVSHLVDGGIGPVTNEQMVRAAALTQYLEGHARRIYSTVTHGDAEAVSRLADRLKRGDLLDQFGARDVYRAGWLGLSDRETVAAALDRLCDLNWLRAEEVDTGGRPKIVYHINPKVGAIAR
jgi:hypothetical protein